MPKKLKPPTKGFNNTEKQTAETSQDRTKSTIKDIEYAKMHAENLRLNTPKNKSPLFGSEARAGLKEHTIIRESSKTRAMKVMEELAKIQNNI